MSKKILVACEESQAVTKAFRDLGFEAYSCDILPCSGGHHEWHIQGDILDVLNGGTFTVVNGESIHVEKWDAIIAFPPCTYLTVTGNKWMKPEFKNRFPNRVSQRQEAVEFFLKLANADCENIALENPVGIMSSVWRKPDQYIHPYHFGDPHSKKTGLWLKGLPKLKHTDVIEPQMYVYKDGRKDPIWHVESLKLPKEERSKIRSKTFPGVAKEMASQWGGYLSSK